MASTLLERDIEGKEHKRRSGIIVQEAPPSSATLSMEVGDQGMLPRIWVTISETLYARIR